MAGCTHSSNWEEDLNKEPCESVSDVFVLHFEEVVATLMQELHTGLQLLDRVHLEQANSGTFWWQETETNTRNLDHATSFCTAYTNPTTPRYKTVSTDKRFISRATSTGK